MKKYLLLILICFLLCGCSAERAEPAQTPLPTLSPTPSPTPLPTPTPDVMLGGELVPWDSEALMPASLEGLEEALPLLPKLKRVDLTACEVTGEQMELYSALRPDVDFLWIVSFGKWQVRSDITCFSTLRTGENHRYSSEELYPLLRWCNKLRALDLGHNNLTDISLLAEMPELQVLILADNPNLTDISALAELPQLHYLELFLCRGIEDFSPLYGLEKLQDINCSWCKKLEDISFLENMPQLRMGWFRDTGAGHEQADALMEQNEDCFILVGSPADPSSVIYGWRATERNRCIRDAFSQWSKVKEYRRWDDVEYIA